MKIYTKTGDDGKTSVVKGRISKASDTIELIGTLDEFNAFLGVVREILKENFKEFLKFDELLMCVQSSIFSIGAIVVGAELEINLNELTKKIEKSIDEMDSNLPTLKNFILPGGNKLGSRLHVCRAICRKAERRFVSYTLELDLLDEKLLTPTFKKNIPEIRAYLNRLSDWLFVFARYVNFKTNFEEEIWKS
ncbi:MAG: ATP--cob(I)alamin adenosyltransferase [Candidatus Dojkabacteria bacterium]|nr:MAG: ATP--cob(I)alamin adenosyltransferase [Candidatus Dojkabacteria bacterium]